MVGYRDVDLRLRLLKPARVDTRVYASTYVQVTSAKGKTDMSIGAASGTRDGHARAYIHAHVAGHCRRRCCSICARYRYEAQQTSASAHVVRELRGSKGSYLSADVPRTDETRIRCTYIHTRVAHAARLLCITRCKGNVAYKSPSE